MKAFLAILLPATMAGGVYYHGPLAEGEVYPKPAGDVTRILETLSLPGYVNSTVASLPGGSTTRDVEPGKSVTYYFHARGGQAAKFIATITPVDATHTRVSTSMTMSGEAARLLKAPYMAGDKEFATVGAAAMREQIDARLEDRPFNQQVVTSAMKGFAMANIGTIQKAASEAMDEAVKLQKDSESSTGPVYQPGKPMMKPNPVTH